MTIYCTQCNEPCAVVEETFDYAGTHCTNGYPGTHRTGIYVSDCCLVDVSDEPFENICPDCDSDAVIACRREGNAVAPECDFWECEECGTQWGHQ